MFRLKGHNNTPTNITYVLLPFFFIVCILPLTAVYLLSPNFSNLPCKHNRWSNIYSKHLLRVLYTDDYSTVIPAGDNNNSGRPESTISRIVDPSNPGCSATVDSDAKGASHRVGISDPRAVDTSTRIPLEVKDRCCCFVVFIVFVPNEIVVVVVGIAVAAETHPSARSYRYRCTLLGMHNRTTLTWMGAVRT